jgi:ferric-dicitrate binding protein FerR (iron transport regulator)
MSEKTDDYLWDPSAPADPEIERLERLLRPLAYRERPLRLRPARRLTGRMGALLAAAAALLVALFAGREWMMRDDPHAWRVEGLAGAPRVGDERVGGDERLPTGKWLETDAGSRARVELGGIGYAEVGPNSRLAALRSRAGEHRMSLRRGTIDARVWAPPRVFMVETPAALAVDLGCAYVLSVGDDGSGQIRVTSGYVELVNGGRRSVVPAGSVAQMRPGHGPGTPYPEGSPAALRAALDALDFGGFRRDALDAALAGAGADAAPMLWHLLQRVPPHERARVYDRLAAVAAPPAGASRAAALRLDPRAMELWQRELGLLW